MDQLSGQVALVTGAASGIGRGIAKLFVERGASVMLADLDENGAQTAASALGENSRAIRCDVVDSAQVEAAIAAAVDQLGPLTTMVNNAGISIRGALRDMSEEDFRRVLDVNLIGVWHGIKYAAPALERAGGGSIINISSISAFAPGPLLGAYGATKSAVVSLTQAAATELRGIGVRVNAICPGVVWTEMLERGIGDDTKLLQQVEAGVTAKQVRFASPEDIAKIAAHLASDDASFTSGSAYTADNAMTSGIEI